MQQNPEVGLKLKKGGTITIQLGKAPEKEVVPGVVNEDVNDARRTLENAGFKVTIEQVDSAKPEGTVISQTPTGNARADKGSTVTLRVSKGNQIEMPDLTGLTEEQAEDRLRTLGWNGNLNIQNEQVNTGSPQKDKVISQTPTKGSPISKGSTVTLVIARTGIIPTG